MRIRQIISGGQTGADRGALQAALDAGVPHGGWCPKGRLAEDGVIPACFQLQETNSADHQERTRRNVADSSATLVFTTGDDCPGTQQTIDCARELGTPLCMVNIAAASDPRVVVQDWLDKLPAPPVLNVAGPRESTHPGLAEQVREVIAELLAP